MAKVKIDSALFERAKKAAEVAGYSSIEEFVTDNTIIRSVGINLGAPGDHKADEEEVLSQIRKHPKGIWIRALARKMGNAKHQLFIMDDYPLWY